MSGAPAYERDPFRTELPATVTATGVEEARPYAVLDDTILYPEGGGQPPDHGFLNDVAVVDVQKRSGEIRHYLARPVEAGAVRVRLDWDRRLDHMQQHTGQHLLTAVAQDRFGWVTTAFHLGTSTCDIELATAQPSAADLEKLEDAVSAAIREALPVTPRRVTLEEYAGLTVRTRGLPEGHEGDVRLVEIAGLDLNTCGGTHLTSTAQIELVKLLDTEAIRGGTRLFFVAGRRARHRFAAHEARTARLRAVLGAPDDSLAAAAESRLAELRAAEKRIKALLDELAAASASSLLASSDRVVNAHFDGKDAAFLQGLAKPLSEGLGSRLALLTASGPSGSCFVLIAGQTAATDVASAGARVAGILGGKGGGRGRLFQGKASSCERRGEAVALLSGMSSPASAGD